MEKNTGFETAGQDSNNLRVAVVGTGVMGLDHVRRLQQVISGATVTVLVEPDASRAAAAAALAPQAQVYPDFSTARAAGGFDAVLIATPGFAHEAVLLEALEARLHILCEKPLTMDSESSLRVVRAEEKLGEPRIQVGFMRRFDEGYRKLRQLVVSERLGRLLLVHAAHRNAVTPPSFNDERMLINDAVVHEMDIIPWLAGSRLSAVEVKRPRSSRHSSVKDPQLVLLELENGVLVDVEIYVNCRFGYQVTTEAVFEEGLARIGEDSGPEVTARAGEAEASAVGPDGFYLLGRQVPADFRDRFSQAYDTELQAWVDGCHAGRIAGPTAWDGYLAAAACEAGVRAQASGRREEVKYATR